jgi:soluble lytic murein transglycosylase-like protein
MSRALLAALLVAVALPLGGAARREPAYPVPLRGEPWFRLPVEHAATVERAARRAGVPVWILARVLERESGFRSDAVGVNQDGSRDLGIAQLGERWLDDFTQLDNGGAAFDPREPAEAIPVAARYLARLRALVGSWPLAVAAYNCGPGRVQSGGIPARTRAYVRSIFLEEGTK